MRIIAGEFGGRKLLPPPTEATRPITDRAKQSLFDSLGDRLHGANVLDAFAGTGSMGLESLSRRALRVVFVERDRGAILKRGHGLFLGYRFRTLAKLEALLRGWRSRIVPSPCFAPGLQDLSIDLQYPHLCGDQHEHGQTTKCR
jgi:hypothetical protein